MEIKDYLKVLGKRAWLLVMIPAVAGVVAGLIAVRQPQAFRTTATLQLPHEPEASPAEVAQLVADFRATINNPTIQNGVSEDTGVPVKRIKRIKVTQVGDSSQLTLGIQDKRRTATDSKAVIRGLTNDALGFLEAPEVKAAESALDAANGEVETAQSDLDDANRELTTILSEIQSADPDGDLRVAAHRCFGGHASDAPVPGGGEPRRRRAPSAYRDAILLRIATLQEALPRVHVLQAQAATATTALAEAQAEREAALGSGRYRQHRARPDLLGRGPGGGPQDARRQDGRGRRCGRPSDRRWRGPPVGRHAEAASESSCPAGLHGVGRRARRRLRRDRRACCRSGTGRCLCGVGHRAAARRTGRRQRRSGRRRRPRRRLDELDDELDELDEDVAATVASRRRQYDADIDDDLSVDGGPDDGNVREWARVPAADEDFDGDDEAGADR